MDDLKAATPDQIDSAILIAESHLRTLAARHESALSLVRERLPHNETRFDGDLLAHGSRLANANPGGRKLLLNAVNEASELKRRMAKQHRALVDFDTEYRRRPWQRYAVAPTGTVHAGVACAGGVVRPRTRATLIPGLAGRPVAEVAAEGVRLCGHCFPGARERERVEYCPGSRKPADEWPWARCDCGALVEVTARWMRRAHRPPQLDSPNKVG